VINVSRAEWNARPPESTRRLDRSRVELFIVHYSGGPRDQTVRAIQDYCMDTKGHVDIDYNDIVRGERRYRGRGWNVGGHTLDHNSISYGICVIGRDGDATDADLRTVHEVYDEVCGVLDRRLVMTDHRTVLGRNYTACPGDELHSWVAAGMPLPGNAREGVDMYFLKVRGDNHPEIYQSNGLWQRSVPGGMWDVLCVPLIRDHGVPLLEFDTLEQLVAAGGPIIPGTALDPVVPAPGQLPPRVRVSVPATQFTAELLP
jgi:hypothetical protein